MRHPTDLWISDVRNVYILVDMSNSNGINKKRSPSGIRRMKQLPQLELHLHAHLHPPMEPLQVERLIFNSWGGESSIGVL